eukprot:TRINITY_DN7771_c0_g1_i1.p1 TRINITY_DN7771_c0_g1~~TRINITY_DN7771_c0_g1_i1.p1  ORF type:complete len:1143 (-),score=258.84 TRINITY_DN7771_c0_g1_i1:1162-4206(-)
MSFFQSWWDGHPQSHDKMRKVAQSGQFEIVSGGWVMNDEGVSHYIAVVNQLLEGHEFLRKTLKVKPTTSWSIDPFGHSPTMAFIYNKAKLKQGLIQRTHFAIKKLFAKENTLEFNWRQQWENDTHNTDYFVHMMPFYSYDIPHTCGPEPKVCSTFDFSAMGKKTPWGDIIKRLNPDMLEEKAEQYVDQIKKKAMLFKQKNHVLVPLGDDFKYDTAVSTTNQIENHQMLHDYINSHFDEFKVVISFSNLSNYFSSIKQQADRDQYLLTQSTHTDNDWKQHYPILQGDFFTYADRQNDYWAGYFTTRAYWKQKSRFLENLLRAAEVSYSWARSLVDPTRRSLFDFEGGFSKLQAARRTSALFQHHDAITGTSVEVVVTDYGKKLQAALSNSASVLAESVTTIIKRGDDDGVPLIFDNFLEETMNVSYKKPLLSIKTHSERVLVIYNSLLQPLEEIVSYRVDSPYVIVLDSEFKVVPFQVSPAFDYMGSNDTFNLYIRVSLPPLGMVTLTLKWSEVIYEANLPIAIECFHGTPPAWLQDYNMLKVVEGNPNSTKISTSLLEVSLDPSNGLITAWKERRYARDRQLTESMMAYLKTTSGAYLFRTANHASNVVTGNRNFIIIQGPLVSETITFFEIYGSRTARIYEIDERVPFLEIEYYNTLVKAALDTEYIARFTTSIQSKGIFYTDSQGLSLKQSIRRSDTPIQFNYKPITTVGFIQDQESRFSIHTSWPVGGSSLSDGSFEIMLDRKCSKDDQRGMNQALKENKPYSGTIHLTFEDTPLQNPYSNSWTFQSKDSLVRSLRLNNHPLTLFSLEVPFYTANKILSRRSLLSNTSILAQTPEMHLVTLKVRDPKDYPEDTIAILFRSLADLSTHQDPYKSSLALDMAKEFEGLYLNRLEERSLTLLYPVKLELPLRLSPMDLRTFLVSLSTVNETVTSREDSEWGQGPVDDIHQHERVTYFDAIPESPGPVYSLWLVLSLGTMLVLVILSVRYRRKCFAVTIMIIAVQNALFYWLFWR